ncbi:MAG: aspartate aminotransferase family protein [Blastopirellula sp.]|nr:aspartate aminotransferase family protein [Blastopirellula sp.]
MATASPSSAGPVTHQGEPQSNNVRSRIFASEPVALRTFTPSGLVIAKSEGSYHFTPEGRKLADFSSGVLVANLGHNPTGWWQRVLNYMQLDAVNAEGPFVPAVPLTTYNAMTALEAEANERLLANLRGQAGGNRMEQVLWSASGSEAVQKSLWAALAQNPERDIILATRRGFHGKKGLAGAVTGSEEDHERDPRVRFITFPVDECIDVDARRQPLDLTPYADELAALKDELGDRICAVITEPYLGGGGSFHPQAEYLQLLQSFCREADALFILDEIQSNFGRTGPMYAYTHYGLEPDIVCLGKGLGNGVPVSAAVGRSDVFGALQFGEGSDTWSANPLSCAAVLATLDEFETTNVLEQGQQLATVIEAGLVRLQETGIVTHVRGEGCVWGIECRGIGQTPAHEIANECVRACYLGDEAGNAIHLLGPLAGKVIRVSPPLVMPPDECQHYLDTMHQILSHVANQHR